jgi:lipopolysaccharide/colanic/teichoic acid biosynthesis glycosyltransferase
MLSLTALIVLCPIMLILTVIGAIAMRGNPFFVQPRPGKRGKDGNEKIFNLIKFRTMSNAKDKEGKLLPDEKRLNKYGKFLRSTSLDELPELINILIGNMSIVGPRPLLVEYLPYYTEIERQRHNVRPGLTGLSQISGRNFLEWDKRLAKDIEYVNNISFIFDISIILSTAVKVIKREGVSEKRIEPLNRVREKTKR